jgi:hypothetical protein
MHKQTGLYIASACVAGVAGVAVAAQHYLVKSDSYITGSNDALLQTMNTRLDETMKTMYDLRYKYNDILETLKELERDFRKHFIPTKSAIRTLSLRNEWAQGWTRFSTLSASLVTERLLQALCDAGDL